MPASKLHSRPGSIVRSAKRRYLNYSEADFEARRGDTLHQWGWNLARRRGPKLVKFHPHLCNNKGIGPPKLIFLLRFDQNVEYKRPAGAYLLRDFHKIGRVCNPFQDALAVIISLDLLKGLQSYRYGGF